MACGSSPRTRDTYRSGSTRVATLRIHSTVPVICTVCTIFTEPKLQRIAVEYRSAKGDAVQGRADDDVVRRTGS